MPNNCYITVKKTSNNNKTAIKEMSGLNGDQKPGPEVIILFSSSTQLSMKFVLLINLKLLKLQILSC